MSVHNLNEKPQVIFSESKFYLYIIPIAFLVLGFFTVIEFIFIAAIMILFLFFSSKAKICIYEDYLIYEKKRKKIIKYSDIKGVHQDPVFSTNIFSYFLSSKFRIGGFFIETKDGFTEYIGSVYKNNSFLLPFSRSELIKEITDRSKTKLYTGTVSSRKNPTRLKNMVLLLFSILLVPILIILFFGFFTGTLDESIQIIKDLF